MDKQRHIAIYIRVSSVEQARSKEGSLASQQQRCNEYLEYKYRDSTAILYKDEGLSAKNTNRPGYQRLVTNMRVGLVSVVCCTELSRISRSVLDFHGFLQICQEHQVDFVSLREQFDTSTAHGKLMLGVFAAFAQFEREQISERTAANMRARARRGLYNGGKIYGYRPRPGQKGYLDIDRAEATVINLIFDQYLQIGSYCLVANWLNRAGYRTREYVTKTGRLKPAAKWNKNSVLQILKNLMYIGKRRISTGEVVQGTWESIVSEEKFDAVQGLIARNERIRGNAVAHTNRHEYLFGGLVRCVHCNVFLESGAGTGRNRVYFYYRHPTRTRLPGCPCRDWPAGELENLLCNRLLTLFDDSELLEMVCDEFSQFAIEKKRDIDARIASLTNQIDLVSREAAGLVQKIHLLCDEDVREFISPRLEEMRQRREELVRQKQVLEAELFEITRKIITPDEIRQSFTRMRPDFWYMDDVRQKLFIGEIVQKVEMYEDRMIIWIWEVEPLRDGSRVYLSGDPVKDTKRTNRIKSHRRILPFPMILER